MPSLAAPNRYAQLIEADELKKYTETFAAYDRDGGGEVDSTAGRRPPSDSRSS